MRYMESVSGGGKSEIDVSTGLIRVRVVEQSLTENFGGIMGKTEIFKQEHAGQRPVRPTHSCWLFSYFYGSTP